MDERIRQKIAQLAKKYAPNYIQVRRHLHQNPELSFQEHATYAFIKKQLQAIGITNIISGAGTGLLAAIKGNQKQKSIQGNQNQSMVHGNKNQNAVVLRADIDALPILEKNKVSYTSKSEGIMHACGHDVHTASLLLCAKILFELKEDLKESITLLFQPGEEVMPGGASLVMKEKAYRALGSLPHIGQHVRPDIPVGKVGFRSGKFMASMDELFMTVKGKGGHAAMPENTVDPVLIASHIIVAAQQLVSRKASPKTPSVLSFGKVVADGAINVIPDEVYIEGTFRTLDETWRKEALLKLEKLVTSMAEGMGGSCELKINHGYPHLVNDSRFTETLKTNAIHYLGVENVLDLDPWMAAEDFAYYAQKNPACLYMLGVGNIEKGITSGRHTPTFDIDESSVEIGGGLMAWLAINSFNGFEKQVF